MLIILLYTAALLTVFAFRLLGWDKVIEYASNEWVQDIRSYQLPHILKGVGPMHHVTQLGETTIDKFSTLFK